MERLFSYGTLQLSQVQRETFGRELAGTPDALKGWRKESVKITDSEVLRRSGKTHHPVLTRGEGPAIAGMVFEVSAEELAQADAYEVADYERVEMELRSGARAWVYVGTGS